MHRLTARLLLLFALLGNVAPSALAATAAQSHACCVRKAAHRCHGSTTSESDQLAIRGTGCCDHGCCRAATTAQWAHSQSRAAAFFLQTVTARVAASHSGPAATAFAKFQSTRAPPAS